MIHELGPCLVCKFDDSGDRFADGGLGRHLESLK
jgi:hypothetical protein